MFQQIESGSAFVVNIHAVAGIAWAEVTATLHPYTDSSVYSVIYLWLAILQNLFLLVKITLLVRVIWAEVLCKLPCKAHRPGRHRSRSHEYLQEASRLQDLPLVYGLVPEQTSSTATTTRSETAVL